MTVEDFRYGLSLNDLFHEHLLAIDDDNTLVAVVNLLAREVVANGVLVLHEVHVLDAGSLSSSDKYSTYIFEHVSSLMVYARVHIINLLASDVTDNAYLNAL